MNKQELVTFFNKRADEYKEYDTSYAIGLRDAYRYAAHLVGQLDETKVTEEQAWGKIAETLPMTKEALVDHVKKIVMYGGSVTYGMSDEIEKPVIPQFIENWMREVAIGFASDWDKADIIKTWWEYSEDFPQVREYFSDSTNFLTFCRAVIDGYEVEKKPKWVVRKKGYYALYLNDISLTFEEEKTLASFGNEEGAARFNDRAKAEAAATLVDGIVVEVEE